MTVPSRGCGGPGMMRCWTPSPPFPGDELFKRLVLCIYRVNWKTGCKSKDEVKEGDIISCSGKGRVEVKAVSVTKKGKYGVELVRYI